MTGVHVCALLKLSKEPISPSSPITLVHTKLHKGQLRTVSVSNPSTNRPACALSTLPQHTREQPPLCPELSLPGPPAGEPSRPATDTGGEEVSCKPRGVYKEI